MKKVILSAILLFALIISKAQNTDLPGPAANLQTLATGSYIIAMDNSLQVNSGGDFNLKAYGLVVYLLNNNVKIKWSIRAGKAKDGIDFSAPADQLKPTLVTGGGTRNFKSGPFVIDAADTTGVGALIDAFYTANALTGTDRPQVYRLTAAATNADIRYDLTAFRPKAAILTDGGNQSIHIAYMTAAAIPATSYATSAGSDLITNCFTFASEPHNKNSGTAVDNAITSIRNFVLQGGNFLAQCEAIDNYENNPLGRFQTTSGITPSNASVGTTVSYPNPDLSFCQFEGVYNASLTGSLKNWKIVGAAANNEHDFATGTGSNSGVIGASVSKLYYSKGGLVFYLGNHSFATTSLAGINGIRMYMNAFLTPSNTNCPSQMTFTLPLKLSRFSGNVENRKTVLKWAVAENEQADKFEIESSTDGNRFSSCGQVTANSQPGIAEYDFSASALATDIFYRIRIIDKQGRSQYSSALHFTTNANDRKQLFILSNPIQDDIKFIYSTQERGSLVIQIFNELGKMMYREEMNCAAGSNTVIIPSKYTRENGNYIMQVIENGKQRSAVKLVRL